jgi:hypothetical protein
MDFTIEKPALTQNNSGLHAFLQIIPWKGMLSRGIIHGKFGLSDFLWIIHGKSNFMHEYLRKIREKILNYYLAFIMSL